MDVLPLLRELVGRATVSGEAVAQREVMGLLTEVLREGAPHLEVTTGRSRRPFSTSARNSVLRKGFQVAARVAAFRRS